MEKNEEKKSVMLQDLERFDAAESIKVVMLMPTAGEPHYHKDLYESSIKPSAGGVQFAKNKFEKIFLEFCTKSQYPIVISGIDMLNSFKPEFEIFENIQHLQIAVETNLTIKSVLPLQEFLITNPGVINMLIVHRALGVVEHECYDTHLAQISKLVPVCILYDNVRNWEEEEIQSVVDRWAYPVKNDYKIEVYLQDTIRPDEPFDDEVPMSFYLFSQPEPNKEYETPAKKSFRLTVDAFKSRTGTKFYYEKRNWLTHVTKVAQAKNGTKMKQTLVSNIVVAPDGKMLYDFDTANKFPSNSALV